MPSSRHSESVIHSIRHESSVHCSTGAYNRQTTTNSVHTTTSNAGFTCSRPGSESNAHAISHRSRHDYDGVGSRNSSARTQASSGTHHHSHRHGQNAQHPANSSQVASFVYNTNNISDVLVRRQYGFQGSNRVDDAQKHIREFEEKFERHVYEKKG
ncbi:hypothetical protein DV736_g5869, partial [Chaetothyriales sp. CBS 134916]